MVQAFENIMTDYKFNIILFFHILDTFINATIKLRNYLKASKASKMSDLILTYFIPIFHFYTPENFRKLLTLSGGLEIEDWREISVKKFLTYQSNI